MPAHSFSTIILMLVWLFAEPASAQDTLPNFSLFRLSDDKLLIEWKNSDTTLRQLSIQQSPDSTFGYKTILNIPDPRLAQNGTVINRPSAQKMYYRIYLLYPQGRYVITASKRATPVPPTVKVNHVLPAVTEKPTLPKTSFGPALPPDLSQKEIDPPNVVRKKTDTLVTLQPTPDPKPTVIVKKEPEPAKTVSPTSEPNKFKASNHIYTQKDGYPFIALPETWDLSQVQIRFFTENGQPLFEIDHPPIRIFRIDKTNFHRSGWYAFEIWLKGKKTETNRLFIPLEF